MRVPMAPSTQRREVRALIRSPILRSDDVVTDEALGLTTLRAAVAVSPLHPRCLLLPPAPEVEEVLTIGNDKIGYARITRRRHDRKPTGKLVHRWWYRCLERSGLAEGRRAA
jgi:hypothetical protein